MSNDQISTDETSESGVESAQMGAQTEHSPSLSAGPGMVVAFHYDLYDADAQKIESSKGGDPVLYLHGQRGVLPALQDAFIGKRAGDDYSITIPHSKAYGRHYPERKQRVSRKKIETGKQQGLRVGQVISLQGEHGPTPATIRKVGKFNVDVDTNHPLAGKDLTFDIQVVSVREASAEEQAHGHAHGVGGHQH